MTGIYLVKNQLKHADVAKIKTERLRKGEYGGGL
jgi:hypothetical protein